MTGDFKLVARGLCRDYAGTRVVRDVAIELATGDILGLLGPNGAGKTTTLRMLAGTLAPSAGRITIAGQALAEAPRRARRHLGYLPERPPLYPELTVDEYLGFCARMHGLPRCERRAAITTAKADCGLEQARQRVIGHLSRGYQQRVGIAQAILHRPDVVILDEPTAGLDPNQLRGVRELIVRLARERSLIISSHILPEIQAVASRIMIMHRGHIVFDERSPATAGAARVIEIELAAPPDTATITAIDGVTAVRETGAGRWQVTARPGHDIRAALARTAVDHDWGLVGLTTRPCSLEERFAALTSHSTTATA